MALYVVAFRDVCLAIFYALSVALPGLGPLMHLFSNNRQVSCFVIHFSVPNFSLFPFIISSMRKNLQVAIKKLGKKTEIEAVIVASSRDLGMQIVREIEKLLGLHNKRVVQQLVGGANRSRQEEALKKNKPLIVVVTRRIAKISAAGKLHTHGCRYWNM
ncbi:hypothetical protein POTOM_000872 [Populus tomentosa]|uniref:RNA helicase n=1 Tax=Populus tomentosa TaxID=118781 RepID=A0A8X8DGV9_POPTO|nr:hypothetical protein POTOM_000872 [Populus tomentosa]